MINVYLQIHEKIQYVVSIPELKNKKRIFRSQRVVFIVEQQSHSNSFFQWQWSVSKVKLHQSPNKLSFYCLHSPLNYSFCTISNGHFQKQNDRKQETSEMSNKDTSFPWLTVILSFFVWPNIPHTGCCQSRDFSSPSCSAIK